MPLIINLNRHEFRTVTIILLPYPALPSPYRLKLEIFPSVLTQPTVECNTTTELLLLETVLHFC